MKETTKNNFLDKLQHKGPQVLIYGFLLIAIYKVWKTAAYSWFIQSLESDIQYASFELAKTIYRIAATIAGVLILRKYFSQYKREIFKDNVKITCFSLLIILPLVFISRTWMFDFSFFPKSFIRELFFNFFTGTFEEIAFRGLILVGLAQYLNPLLSVFLSSVIFSLWHYDVIEHYSSYFFIFTWGFYAGLSYLRGNSLFSLIIFHFLWDQIFFGLNWTLSPHYSQGFVSFTECLIIAPFIWLLLREKSFDKKET